MRIECINNVRRLEGKGEGEGETGMESRGYRERSRRETYSQKILHGQSYTGSQ
jgi:hypothetical protein